MFQSYFTVMIANFAEDVSDVWVFLDEGDLEALESESIAGDVLDTGRPGQEPGAVELSYSPESTDMRPDVERVDEDGVSSLEIDVPDHVYQKLADDSVYHDRVGAFQDLPEASKIWIFPYRETGQYDYMKNDLQFYAELTDDQREQYREIE